MRVLLIERDEYLRRTIEAWLVEAKHVVVSVPTPKSALVELGRGTFDLLITDSGAQSQVSALEMMDKIRKDPFFKEINTTPILVQSTTPLGDEAQRLGAAFLHKIYRKDEFFSSVEQAVLLQTGSLFK